MRFRTASAVVLMALAVTVVAACQRTPEEARDAAIVRGDSYMAEKKYQEAGVEYRWAVEADPKSALAFTKLGEAYLASDEYLNAMGSFIRASDLAPEDLDLNIRAGKMLLAAGRFQDAKTRARNILVKDPGNVAGLVMLGNALAGLQSLDEAVDVAAKAAALEPERAGLLGNVGVFELARGNTDDAERVFRQAVEKDPTATGPLLALSNLYQSTGRISEAEAGFRKVLAMEPKSVAANSALAALLVQTGRPKEAEPFLRTAADASDTVQASLGLADYLVAIGRTGEGLAMLEELAQKKEGFAASRMRKAIIDHASGRQDEAHAALREVLKREPNNVPVMALQSRLLLSENRIDEAETVVKAAIEANPRQPQAHVALGRILRVKGDIEPARKAFLEALNLNATRADALMELARLHLFRREMDTAIDYADTAVKNHSDNLEAWLTLVRTLSVRSDDFPKAEGHLKNLRAQFPNSSDVVALGGILALRQADQGRARQLFELTLQMDPDNREAMGGLATIDAENGRLPEARARIERRLAAAKKADPDLLMLAVKIAVAANDPRGVEQNLKRLIDADPTNLDSYMLLGQFYVAQGRLAEARREYEGLMTRNPRLASVHTMMGMLRQAEGDLSGARQAFQTAVRLEPKSAAAANNLAWMYAKENTNLDEALLLAQTARSQSPDSPTTADTLAFVYYRKGMGSLALPLLDLAIEAQPKNPLYHYHLGLVHAQAGEDAKARKSLQTALELDPRFEGADDAKSVMAKLVY